MNYTEINMTEKTRREISDLLNRAVNAVNRLGEQIDALTLALEEAHKGKNE